MRIPTTSWLFVAVCCAAVGCADLLGIDDGIPRGNDASTDAAAKPDVFTPLRCGSATCNFAAVQSCCFDEGGAPSCANDTTTCDGLYVPCDRVSQCEQGGDAGPIVCCADYNLTEAGIVTTGVSCVPAADCNAANQEFVLCGGDAGASDCQGDASCGISAVTLPTFAVCLGDGVQ